MVAPRRSWPRLACGTTTSVSRVVVTGTRVPLAVMRVKPAVLAPDTVPQTGTKPVGLTARNGGPTVMMAAAIVPPDLEPRTMTDAPSLISLRSGPDRLINVDGVVVTVTGWPLAVLRTRLLPFTRWSVPAASSSPVHPPTAVRTVPAPVPDVPNVMWTKLDAP